MSKNRSIHELKQCLRNVDEICPFLVSIANNIVTSVRHSHSIHVYLPSGLLVISRLLVFIGHSLAIGCHSFEIDAFTKTLR